MWSPLEAHGLPSPWRGLLSLREDVYLEEVEDGSVILHGRWGDVTVRRAGPIVRTLLTRMSLGPVHLMNVTKGQDVTATELASVLKVLKQIEFLVIRSLGYENGQLLLSAEPIAPAARLRPGRLSADTPIRLSRFATLRTNRSDYLLESPLSLYRVTLHRPESVQLISSLARPTTPTAAMAHAPDDRLLVDALTLLVATGMVVRAEPEHPSGEVVFTEDVDPALAAWSPLDLMFHTRSNLGRHDHDFGATYPLGNDRSPEPAVRPVSGGATIPLPRPGWEEVLSVDPPLIVAVEGRRSTRHYTGDPVTLRELGELLYRTARVRSLLLHDGADEPAASNRPYPSGGASYELEIYITTAGGQDLPGGVYHYNPLDHRLEVVNTDMAVVAELLRNAKTAANASGTDPVLLTLTARFRRVSWKYTGLTYALMLKHVGVLTQSLYLVATAMGLSACALGAGNIDTSARAFGTDWRTESSLGELLVGRADPAPSRSHWHPVNDADWEEYAIALLKARTDR